MDRAPGPQFVDWTAEEAVVVEAEFLPLPLNGTR